MSSHFSNAWKWYSAYRGERLLLCRMTVAAISLRSRITAQVGRQRCLTATSRGGRRGQHPTVIFLRGGGSLLMGSEPGESERAGELTLRGYAVLMVDSGCAHLSSVTRGKAAPKL
jgi:hypothetical protein